MYEGDPRADLLALAGPVLLPLARRVGDEPDLQGVDVVGHDQRGLVAFVGADHEVAVRQRDRLADGVERQLVEQEHRHGQERGLARQVAARLVRDQRGALLELADVGRDRAQAGRQLKLLGALRRELALGELERQHVFAHGPYVLGADAEPGPVLGEPDVVRLQLVERDRDAVDLDQAVVLALHRAFAAPARGEQRDREQDRLGARHGVSSLERSVQTGPVTNW